MTDTSDLITRVREELIASPEVLAVVGSGPEPLGPWVWRWELFVSPEDSGRAAIVLRQEGAWTTPNRHNTAEFPRIRASAYSSEEDQILQALRAASSVLHRPDGHPDPRVVSSHRLTEPSVGEVPDSELRVGYVDFARVMS